MTHFLLNLEHERCASSDGEAGARLEDIDALGKSGRGEGRQNGEGLHD